MAEKFRLRALKAPRQISRSKHEGYIKLYNGYSTVRQHRCRPCGKRLKEQRRRKTVVKRVLYLAMVALVAMLILVPTAMAQEQTVKMEATVEKDLAPSGGVAPGSLVLPATALLIGGGVLGYAVLRRREDKSRISFRVSLTGGDLYGLHTCERPPRTHPPSRDY